MNNGIEYIINIFNFLCICRVLLLAAVRRGAGRARVGPVGPVLRPARRTPRHPGRATAAARHRQQRRPQAAALQWGVKQVMKLLLWKDRLNSKNGKKNSGKKKPSVRLNFKEVLKKRMSRTQSGPRRTNLATAAASHREFQTKLKLFHQTDLACNQSVE